MVLTGGFETAKLFRGWRADLPLIAETSGKNAIVVTPSADFDLAVADIAKSAFGHAGQKCSAASLVITVGSVGTSERFRRQLLDAVTSLRVGYPDDPASVTGPVIEPPGPKLHAGFIELAPGESWLLEPRQLDESGRLWSPGIRHGVKPGNPFHQTEYFGPILGIIQASNLAEAVKIQNGVAYGLTAGIHSQDPNEVSFWLDNVEAGNCYVNRGITGAIVRRQSFGGWKRSAVGATAKAGGPNYLTCFGHFEPRDMSDDPLPPLPDDPALHTLIDAASSDGPDRERRMLHLAAASDDTAWATHFGVAKDESGVGVERNLFRYHPTEVTIRVSAFTPVWEVVRVVMAARRVNATVHLSITNPLPEGVQKALTRPGGWSVASLTVESELAFVKRVQATPPARIRLLNGSEAVMQVHFDGNPEVAIWSGPVTLSGRVEALPFVVEQAVSMTVHRFGTPDSRFVALAESLERRAVNQLR